MANIDEQNCKDQLRQATKRGHSLWKLIPALMAISPLVASADTWNKNSNMFTFTSPASGTEPPSAPPGPGLTDVIVKPGSLHLPNTAMGLSYSGKVDYVINALNFDSLDVTLSIVPAAGGTPLVLSEVSSDVGAIRNVIPNMSQTRTIYFQAAAQQNVQYIAKITATALVSAAQAHVEATLASMTKDQKAILFGGGIGFQTVTTGPVPRLWTSDGPNGVKGTPQATCFATGVGEASTWDTSLASQQGAAKGEEFRALKKNVSLGPAFNLVYHPLGGRASEYFSEDPYLSGRMAAADAMGIQSKGVAATIKHFACNNMERDRRFMSETMSERSLQELFFYNWKPSIDAGCLAMMSAHNRINSSYASSNKYLMTDVLRNQWGFRGLVMTDWGANFDNFSDGMNYGIDLEMPKPVFYLPATVAAQSDDLINMHARRVVYVHEMLGDMVPGYNVQAYASTLLNHRPVARAVATDGITLGRNSGNVLPIPKTGKKVAIIGPFANQCRRGPDGSSLVNARDLVTPLYGITSLLTGTDGYPVIPGATTLVTDLNTADYIVVFIGVTGEREGGDRAHLEIQAADGETDVSTALAVTTAKTIVVYTGGSAASAGVWSTAPGIVFALYPGQEQGFAIADVLFGNANPAGKLPITFPVDNSQLPNWQLDVNKILQQPPSDTAHGYFRVNKLNQTPLFNFGHGLSYTNFDYSDLQIYPTNVIPGDRVRVRVKVTNSGSRAGKEVAQLYLSMPSGNPVLPVRVQDLRGFQKVSLAAGQSTTVDFLLTSEEMRVFDPNGADYNGSGRWQVLPGTYGVRVGTSSQRDLMPTISSAFTVGTAPLVAGGDFNVNFDGDAVNAPPTTAAYVVGQLSTKPSAITTSGTTELLTVVDNFGGMTSRAVKFESLGATNRLPQLSFLGTAIADKKCIFECDASIASFTGTTGTEALLTCTMVNGASNELVAIVFRKTSLTGGDIQIQRGTSGQTVFPAWTFGTPVHLKAVLDPVADVYSVYVNGVAVQTNAPFVMANVRGVLIRDGGGFSGAKNGSSFTAAIDNVTLTRE